MSCFILHISTNKYWLCLLDILSKPGKLLLAQCLSCCPSPGLDQQEGVFCYLISSYVTTRGRGKGLLIISEKGNGFHSGTGMVDENIRAGATSCGLILSGLVRLSGHFAGKSPSFFGTLCYQYCCS